MTKSFESGATLEEALSLLGYSVARGPEERRFSVRSPEGEDVGELTPSECWALLRDRHREAFEADPPDWDAGAYGAFALDFTGFCEVCGLGTFNGRHRCRWKDD
jgi:hypothetical protein